MSFPSRHRQPLAPELLLPDVLVLFLSPNEGDEGPFQRKVLRIFSKSCFLEIDFVF